MPVNYDYEKDTLYLRGYEKGYKEGFKKGYVIGREEERSLIIIKLWEKGVEIIWISYLLDVSLEKVERICIKSQNEIQKNKIVNQL
jgi:flagellar biosynthesis/type III secretory pathway protein FliH